jgi:hypothetical protein
MNFKTTYILFGILVGLLTVFFLSQMTGRKPGWEKYVMTDLRDAKVRTQDIDTVEIERFRTQAEKVVLVRDADNQGWKMTQPHQFRVEGYLVDQVVNQVYNAQREEAADLPPNLKQAGLESPSVVVTLRKGVEQEWKLNLGEESIGTATSKLVYVTSTGRPNEPAAVKRSDLDSLFTSVKDFRSKDLLAERGFDSASNILYVKLQETGGGSMSLEKTKNGIKSKTGRWRFESPAYGDADEEGDTSATGTDATRVTGVKGLLSAVEGIRVESSEDFEANDVPDLAKYGLEADKPKTLRIEIKRVTGSAADKEDDKKEPPLVQQTLLVGDKADPKGDKFYARLEKENHVVKVPARSIEPISKLLKEPATLRDRDLVKIDQFKTDAIDIKNASGLVQLRNTGTPAIWKLYDDSAKAREADHSAVTTLLSTLTAKRQVKDFPDKNKSDAELGLDQPTAVVSLWVEGIKKEDKKEEKKDKQADDPKKEEDKDKAEKEKKDAAKEEKKDADPRPKLEEKPTVQLEFGKKDKDVVYVKRKAGGQEVRLAVAETLLAKVTEEKVAYLSKVLPSFSRDADVTKVVLERGNETVILEKEKKDDKTAPIWKLSQPEHLKGRTADAVKVDRIISELRDLRTDKLVAEKAADNELERYGLKSPELKATVTVQTGDKKTEDRAYLFGKENDPKSHLYAKQGEHDLVFFVKPEVLTPLRADLADPRIFTFTAPKVKEVKLEGWQKVLGFPVKLQVERKPPESKTWAVKEGPAGFQLDDQKVEELVSSLATLSAEQFVVYKTGPKPEHELGDKDRALQIELVLEGEKEPVTLTLGKLDAAKKGYYAQSSGLPGDVFLLPQDRFEKLLGGVKHFAK